MAASTEAAMDSLRQLCSTEPPVWIAPKTELSETVRVASKHLFSCLKPHAPKSPFDQLLTERFDAEQIWQQIDLQSQPLLSSLRREVKRFEKNSDELFGLKDTLKGEKKKITGSKENKENDFGGMDFDMEDGVDDEFDDDDDDDGDEDAKEKGDSDEISGSEAEVESEEDDMERDSEGEENGGVEDKFLKIKHLQKYLEEDEAREYGYGSNKKKAKKEDETDNEDEDDGEEEEDDDDNDEEDELGLFNAHDEEGEDSGNQLENARYSDFFVANKHKGSQKRSKQKDISTDDERGTDNATGNQKKDSLSTHEKELQKLQSKIKQMEQENLDPKFWTMQGEVTAAQRQKNSALEVHLDFEHNMRPAPVITEEVTASIEDMIKIRVLEGRFDDVQKPPSLPSKAAREVKELDESKSKKGLAEVYEEEYVQKTDPAFTPSSFSDEQKKEASMLFKRLCVKLDALSHFHFTPKPVIEDMSIQANIPALAMEEIAPVAVSDAAMLAPEEVFAGKGDIKEETEFSKADRKRRRATKKRKYKAAAAKRTVKKAGHGTSLNQGNVAGKGE